MINPTYALHGNLQTPAVWEPFRQAIPGLHAIDLWQSSASSFAAWAEDFCARVETETRSKPSLLIGYSLGGRLALHALLHQPALWHGIIIIGAHTGLCDQTEQAARLQADQVWSERFRTEPWDDLMRNWNAQAVFGGKPNPHPPCEADFDRERIARLLDLFSLGRQKDLLPDLKRLYQTSHQAPPLLYLSGEYDMKFCAIGERLANNATLITQAIIPDTGHRAPWENPQAFIQRVQAFVERL